MNLLHVCIHKLCVLLCCLLQHPIFFPLVELCVHTSVFNAAAIQEIDGRAAFAGVVYERWGHATESMPVLEQQRTVVSILAC